ncbi:MAG: insulinase family protein [Alistipes sp.]|jgi:predicted Zn-dependent peptidase|nr:insulinase family protein [Alistipes sp.]
MIDYSEHTLANGLRVVVNRAPSTEMAAVNVLYRVGARNENPLRTGFAHLFEHLMFRGTRAVPDFDAPLHKASAENNAFTNNDYTDYYITLPRENVETALWIEADRMTGLQISPEVLEAEKKVVVEEFNQRYINQPYGDQWLLVRQMAYKVHPYRWPTIGLSPEHIMGASVDEVMAFYRRYYNPANAILSVAADIEPARIFEMAEKWFGAVPGEGITGAGRPVDVLPPEPLQTQARRMEVERDVPATAITIAFPMGGRTSRNYYACDILSDLLAGGSSARLYESLVRRQRLFSGVNAYITGDLDPGLFVVTGHLLPEVSVSAGEEALWEELRRLCGEPAGDYELEKVKNKFEAETAFGELNVMNRAMNLGFYDMVGDLGLINREVEIYRSFSAGELVDEAGATFRHERSSTLIYNGGKR